jgi:RNA-directed DNA polymerase
MHCRAQQALHLLALEPIAETIADKNAYGFRPHRSTADAIERCVSALVRKGSAQYILEGDIQSCFDQLSHQWLLQHVPTDKGMLAKWLKAGYMDGNMLYDTNSGTPQGGIVSPTLLTIALHGLEAAINAVTKPRYDKTYLCTYADDFIVTGVSVSQLENKVKPVIEDFLAERGLKLSPTKTKITHIDEGFDFLGVNIRKYNGKLICKPAKENTAAFLRKIRQTIKGNATAKTEHLIQLLNPIIRGWGNFHRHNSAKRTFGKADHQIFNALWRWAKRRHPNKGRQWIKRKYFRSRGNRHWAFFADYIDHRGKPQTIELFELGKIPIRRYIKIRVEATPYDPAYKAYFADRHRRRKSRKLDRPCEQPSWSPWWEIEEPSD